MKDDSRPATSPLKDARDHPTVRPGGLFFHGKRSYPALVLVALGLALLVKKSFLSILGAVSCFAGAGFCLRAGEWMVHPMSPAPFRSI